MTVTSAERGKQTVSRDVVMSTKGKQEEEKADLGLCVQNGFPQLDGEGDTKQAVSAVRAGRR